MTIELKKTRSSIPSGDFFTIILKLHRLCEIFREQDLYNSV